MKKNLILLQVVFRIVYIPVFRNIFSPNSALAYVGCQLIMGSMGWSL